MSHPPRSASRISVSAIRALGNVRDGVRNVIPRSRPDLAWERPASAEASTQRLLELLFSTLLLAVLFFALQPAGLAMATYGSVGLTTLGAPLLLRRARRLYVVDRVSVS